MAPDRQHFVMEDVFLLAEDFRFGLCVGLILGFLARALIMRKETVRPDYDID